MAASGVGGRRSPSKSGVVTGTLVYVGNSTVEEIDALGSRLRRAIVLTARPQTEYLSRDRQEPSQGDGPSEREILLFRAQPAE
jgi:hypothetical protein